MERGRVPFILSGSTLVSAINNVELYDDHIDIGVKQSELTVGAVDVMNTAHAIHKRDGNTIIYIMNDVPVHVKIYEDNTAELQNPDTLVYFYEIFSIPNPVKTFLQKQI